MGSAEGVGVLFGDASANNGVYGEIMVAMVFEYLRS